MTAPVYTQTGGGAIGTNAEEFGVVTAGTAGGEQPIETDRKLMEIRTNFAELLCFCRKSAVFGASGLGSCNNEKPWKLLALKQRLS